METIFSLVTAVVMVAIALSVIIDGIKSLLNPASRVVPQPVALIEGRNRVSYYVSCLVYESPNRT